MATSRQGKQRLKPPGASRQVAFHQLLVAARKLWLADALDEALKLAGPRAIKDQTLEYAPEDALKILAAAGIRDEYVFPVPVLLETQPRLVGYYRLLLGAPQKSFYEGSTGMGRFRSMEVRGTVTKEQQDALPAFCKHMCEVLADLVRQLSPAITRQDVAELPLLTLGSQFQGANNNTIGKLATADVFQLVADLVKPSLVDRTERKLRVKNASGRLVSILLASDPDIRIQEDADGTAINKVAIEIKGGTDRSNAHNRAGEAEKSHQKAKRQNYRGFWTLIAKKGLDVSKLQHESPTTDTWLDIAQVLGRTGQDWEEFRRKLAVEVGIPVNKSGKPR